MIMFEDSTAEIDEPRSARLEACMQPTVKDTIRHAAVLSGVEVGSFVVSTAYTAAKATIAAHNVTILDSKADRASFFNALENPPQPNRRLSEAFRLRKSLIVNAD